MKIILLISLLIAQSLQAGEVLSKLPYGIVLNKEVPEKVKPMLYNNSKEEKHIAYVSGKLKVYFNTKSNKRIVTALEFGYYQKLPKNWKRANLKLCNDYNKGTSYDEVKKLIKKEKATKIEEYFKRNKKVILFDIKDKSYSLDFIQEQDNYCKGGLQKIIVYQSEVRANKDSDY